LVCRSEEQAGEFAFDLRERVFDEAVFPASFSRLAECNDVLFAIDEFTFFLGEGLFIVHPVC